MEPSLKQLPAYKRKIQERQERKVWPSHDEVMHHPNTSPFLIENNCDADCPYVYECVVVRMKCPPGTRRLWLAWSQGL